MSEGYRPYLSTAFEASEKCPTIADSIKRLRMLRRVLAGKESRHIRLNKWGCGSVACVGGWATQIPMFRKQGLRERIELESVGPHLARQPALQDDENGLLEANEAMGKVFGLNFSATEVLISGNHLYNQRTHKQEALARIDHIIEVLKQDERES